MTSVAVYHNILWSRYKGEVFSALHALGNAESEAYTFVQIAETEGDRALLSPVDLRYHRYPFELLFKGAYGAVPRVRLAWSTARHVARNPARLIVLPGYHRVEFWAMLVACVLSRKPRAVFCDSTRFDKPRNWWKGLLKRAFFNACDGYFGYGVRSAEYLLENGARGDRIYQPCQAAALPIGFDTARALAQRVSARAREASPRFLFVGRLAPEKGLDTLLQAFRQFKAARGEGQLVLVGAGPDRDALVARAGSLGLADSVQFTGGKDIDGVAEEYSRATCLVLPSTSEPWGLVVNEALHYGCPIIVSDACGCRPELVEQGVTGFAFDSGNVAQLAHCLALAVDGLADAAGVGRGCQAHIAQYSPQHAAKQIRDGCMAILQSPRWGRP